METLELLKSGQMVGQTSLKLSAGLSEFPREILELADSLEFLNLSNNRLSELPDDFWRLKKLKIAFFNDNAFEMFPAVLAKCPALSMVSFKNNQIEQMGELSENIRWLILTNNRIKQLPAGMGRLSKLQKLMLAGNQLQTLPDELADCKRLELIRLSANNLGALPGQLVELPRLSWLAYAGNPFCTERDCPASEQLSELRVIDERELTFGEVLGQGASGVIYKGVWRAADAEIEKDVAIKLFKGEITSDGSPLDEMQACITAGTNPNLVSVLGKLQAEGKEGLVFSFVPAEYKNLGEPPSLETCTRDIYAADTTFSLSVVLRIARGIASVVRHLHARGIMHGDLYAHNILIDEEGESLLGDFGAASFYDVNSAVGQRLERLEVRAFGCLLEDLLDRCAVDEDDSASVEKVDSLRELQADCLSARIEHRPLFPDICQILGGCLDPDT
ncbi:MAG: protein kinase [Leptolyngbya foveolarum]|uniref:Protein kinase n=1 Tax=Leptolyngbya foveolarum TaxID=47253 RepID=A0A2W4VRS1_9CYAN|nr:MAG: protein kinase [Leptolyngbya foveolarum]